VTAADWKQTLSHVIGFFDVTFHRCQPCAGNIAASKIEASESAMKKTTGIQNALDHSIAQFTSKEQLLPLALAKAARRKNVSLSELEIQRLATAILNAREGGIQLDLDPPCGLGATEEEIQATVQNLVDDLTESITDVLQDVSRAISQAVPEALAKAADVVTDHMSESALEHASYLRKAHADRAEAVQRMWGVALDQLDFLRNIVLEWSCEALELRSGPYANPNTAFALDRLVARTYEVVGEIITLARSGYADGALARWRSLHEICVIAMFLAKQSDRCARMYLSHHQVEELRLLEMDRASGTANTYDTHSDRYISHLRRQKLAMVNTFGTAFSSDYGWASIELGRGKTTFRELENHVGLEILRRGYQRANSTVHGGALATLTRISLGISGVDGAIVPPSYGCEVAANYATASLSMMVAELCSRTENADLVAMSIVVHNHASKIREQIAQTQKKISADSPRARILMRKAKQRKSRVKPRRTSRRS
jgi:hypothetical protein